MRCVYLWALNQICALSPGEVDEMGWQDLVMFTIQVDDHNAKVKAANSKIEAQSTQQNWQRM